MNLRTILVLGHSELSARIHRLKGIEIIDEDDDIDVVIDILNYEDADLIIVNTLLSQEKSLILADRAREKQIRVIALIDEEKSLRSEIAALVGAGVNAIVSIRSINEVQEYIYDYPLEFDYATLLPEGGGSKHKKESPSANKTTIAVMGIMHRIGTTTQAILLTKFLTDSGYRAAYIEMNRSGYLRSLEAFYAGAERDELTGKIRYQGIDMFCNPEKIREILDMPYTYYIYDYGSLTDIDTLAWMEKDIKVAVAGSKPQELAAFQKAVGRIYPQNPAYVFSFVDESEKKAIMSQMGESAVRTYFSVYAPDPFTAETGDFYRQITELRNDSTEISSKKEKKGIFRRK